MIEWWQAVEQQMLSRKELIQTAQAKARQNGAPRRVQALSQHDWDALWAIMDEAMIEGVLDERPVRVGRLGIIRARYYPARGRLPRGGWAIGWHTSNATRERLNKQLGQTTKEEDKNNEQ